MSILGVVSEIFIPEKSFFERFIDNVIKDADEFDFFHLNTLVDSLQINESDKIILSNAIPEFENFLKRKDIVETNKKLNLTLNLTDFGRECKNFGGYSKLLKAKQDITLAERLKEERKEKAEELDITKKTWEYKNRRWPYILSSLALIGSIVSIIVNYKPIPKKEAPLNLQPMKSEIQLLQNKVKEMDSLIRVDTLLKKRMK
jgi:hypothetical protein